MTEKYLDRHRAVRFGGPAVGVGLRAQRKNAMASVTIPGAAPGSPITETFGNTANITLALQIRDALVAANTAGVLEVTTVAGGGLVAGPPTNTLAGGVNELVINGAGSYTIPAGSAGAPDYVVVVNPTISGGVTIHGASLTIPFYLDEIGTTREDARLDRSPERAGWRPGKGRG